MNSKQQKTTLRGLPCLVLLPPRTTVYPLLRTHTPERMHPTPLPLQKNIH